MITHGAMSIDAIKPKIEPIFEANLSRNTLIATTTNDGIVKTKPVIIIAGLSTCPVLRLSERNTIIHQPGTAVTDNSAQIIRASDNCDCQLTSFPFWITNLSKRFVACPSIR
jgi:hypothetical protein